MKWNYRQWVALRGWVLTCLLNGVLGIRITELQIPSALVRGAEVTLRCLHERDGQEIYAIKWYKDRQEFYHFLPQSRQQKGVYDVSGFRVALDKSSDSEVTLRDVTDSAAGTYKCEISGEAPNFWTAFEERNVTVVALPERQPEIWGQRSFYRPGENISVNCTSRDASPAVHINWFVNGEQVSRDNIRHWLTPGGGGLMTSTGGLRMTARRHHFKEGSMRLQCTASLGEVYWSSVHVEVPLWGEATRGARSNGLFASGGHQNSALSAVVPALLWVSAAVVFR